MTFIKTLSLFFISMLLTACNTAFKGNAKPGEGTVTYGIEYPYTMQYGIKGVLLPRTITVFFKGKKATFVASAGLGTIQIVDLIDYENGTFTSLFIDELRGNVGCKRTPEEILKNETTPVFEFNPINETKIIAGVTCRKTRVNEISGKTDFEIYYVDKIKFDYMNSPFIKQPCLMLEYTHTINNLTMKLRALSVDFKTPVNPDMFEIKGKYRWLNEKDYYAYLNSL